jgi:hypothetical protein
MTSRQSAISCGSPSHVGLCQAGFLGRECLPLCPAKFYEAVVQAVLLYGSKTWVLPKTPLASLEGFHICALYCLARRPKPQRGPGHGWIYPT